MLNVLPPMSSVRFGSPIVARLGNSDAMISGSYSPEQNFAFASTFPVPFEVPGLEIFQQPELIEGDPISQSETPFNETRLFELLKLFGVFNLALLLLVAGVVILAFPYIGSAYRKTDAAIQKVAEIAA